jgi:competence protein ComEA
MRNFTVALVLALAIVIGIAATARASHAPSVPKIDTSVTLRVDLNLASLLELTRLPGVGVGRAKAIIEYRMTRPFRRPADLLRIKGIGRKLYAKLRPHVVVQPEEHAAQESATPRVSADAPRPTGAPTSELSLPTIEVSPAGGEASPAGSASSPPA